MTIASRYIRTVLDRLRFRARMRRIRPVVWALLWASLAHVSWLAFKGAQVRLQPDAIATGLPGFVYRLLIQPLQWLAEGFQWGEPGLQMTFAMAICTATIGLPLHVSRVLGGTRMLQEPASKLPLPGRRETTWN